MGMFFELETQEAKFLYETSGFCHFYIECACKGKDGMYSGSYFKKENNRTKGLKEHKPRDQTPRTFYAGELLMYCALDDDGLTIVCNDCGREFDFTEQSYRELVDRIVTEGKKY